MAHCTTWRKKVSPAIQPQTSFKDGWVSEPADLEVVPLFFSIGEGNSLVTDDIIVGVISKIHQAG